MSDSYHTNMERMAVRKQRKHERKGRVAPEVSIYIILQIIVLVQIL
jgi:hypothetical protein